MIDGPFVGTVLRTGVSVGKEETNDSHAGRRGRTYNRTVGDSLMHVVNLQMSQFPIGDYVIPGIRESFYGRFTVNLGVLLPAVLKKAHPKASILKSGRVVFNIKANDYRLITVVQYVNGVMMIRFFGSHEEYDKIDAETV